ncbi:unnamed protein product [Cuscuta epithymum]|uniref:Carboxypeptidase n=1 Tax=Cuscuta epithymum TaxID=186058 RepID=A0AAV0FYH5_9ASTE|nr:unnamed protein product [Cuscuta epithymum]CAH9140110.1 unnamed protein product [Cuscuta epithymum]
MERFVFLAVYSVMFIVPFANNGGMGRAIATGTPDGSENWGYVQVRPKARMFWWYYKSPYRIENSTKPWPIILWLQGGPGASGVAVGNFQEVGPIDDSLNPRNSTWLRQADLLFVDNPVGTGYSYVEDKSLLVKTDVEAAADLTALLIEVFNNRIVKLQKSPLFIVAESYGGKFAVTLGLSALEAIEKGKLKLKLGGIALGDSWMSPEDYVYSWGPLLFDVSRLDENGLKRSNSLAEEIKNKIDGADFKNATKLWGELEGVIDNNSNGVDVYNFLLDYNSEDALESTSSYTQSNKLAMKRYSSYLQSLRMKNKPLANGGDGPIDLFTLMNETIREKLRIIPKNFTWGEQEDSVFENMVGDFMRPRIEEVDELLAKGVNMTIYNGQLDVICSTKGTESWIRKLKWKGLKTFLTKERTPIYCGRSGGTKAFTKSYQNLNFYWIIGAGHFVPVDQPCVSLDMVHRITQSPALL